MSPIKLLFALLLSFVWTTAAWATPAFARKEDHACPVCHTAYPELNATGRAYKLDGYQMIHEAPEMSMDKGGSAPMSHDPTEGTKRKDLGLGVILDSIPGFSVRVSSTLVEASADGVGGEAVVLAPLDSVEVIMAGSNGDHWSYLAEMGAGLDDGFAVQGNAVLMYRAAKALSVFTGWTPMFSRDAYNTLSESRRVDHIEHAVQDYLGSTGINMNTEGGVVGAFGTLGPVFYLAEAGPGPGAPISTGEPLDYVGRIGVNISKASALGAFVYDGGTPDASTIRLGADAQTLTDAGNFKGVVMVDLTDSAVLAELGWDLPREMKGFWLVPLAHLDLTQAGTNTSVVPMIGIGIQQSAGRLQLELSEPLGGSTIPLPTVTLAVDAVF